jgi:hypothetical protein
VANHSSAINKGTPLNGDFYRTMNPMASKPLGMSASGPMRGTTATVNRVGSGTIFETREIKAQIENELNSEEEEGAMSIGSSERSGSLHEMPQQHRRKRSDKIK